MSARCAGGVAVLPSVRRGPAVHWQRRRCVSARRGREPGAACLANRARAAAEEASRPVMLLLDAAGAMPGVGAAAVTQSESPYVWLAGAAGDAVPRGAVWSAVPGHCSRRDELGVDGVRGRVQGNSEPERAAEGEVRTRLQGNRSRALRRRWSCRLQTPSRDYRWDDVQVIKQGFSQSNYCVRVVHSDRIGSVGVGNGVARHPHLVSPIAKGGGNDVPTRQVINLRVQRRTRSTTFPSRCLNGTSTHDYRCTGNAGVQRLDRLVKRFANDFRDLRRRTRPRNRVANAWTTRSPDSRVQHSVAVRAPLNRVHETGGFLLSGTHLAKCGRNSAVGTNENSHWRDSICQFGSSAAWRAK